MREYRWFEKLEFYTHTGGYFVSVYFQAVKIAPVVVAVACIQSDVFGNVIAYACQYAYAGFSFADRFSLMNIHTAMIVVIRKAVEAYACADIRFNRGI